MSRSFTLIVNPTSGGGSAREAVLPVARALREAEASVEVLYSPNQHAIPDMVADAAGRGDVVVSVGGDGMLSSVVGPIAAAGAELGIVPAGRGNDFARMLGVPNDPAAQAQLLLSGAAHPTDLISLDGRVLASSVYCGVDATAAALVNRMRFVPHAAQYQVGAVRALAGYRPAQLEVDIDGVAHTFGAATVVIANSAYYGNGMKIAPAAVVDDGLLDVVVIEAASRLQLIKSVPKVYDGSHVQLAEVHVLTGRVVTVRRLSDKEVLVGADGEPMPSVPGPTESPMRVDVLPHAVRVIRPLPNA